MKKLASSLVAGLLAASLATTALARPNIMANQSCDHLKGMAQKGCMRGMKMMKKEMKKEAKEVIREFSKRQVKEIERKRQRMQDEKNNTPVTICHKGGDGKGETMTIPTVAWFGHAEHGDMKGACPVASSSSSSSS